MGRPLYFNEKQRNHLRCASELAETLAGIYYDINADDWERYPYDIQTLRRLRGEEVTNKGFAQLAKYSRGGSRTGKEHGIHDFFRICVQDHVIIKALDRDDGILLEPLFIYIVTHELVHIIRFNRYEKDYFANGKTREREEKEVHGITYELLKDVQYEGLEEVIHAYEWARRGSPHYS